MVRGHAWEPLMSRTVHIDYVADLTCPWCAIGLFGLEQALGRLSGEMTPTVRVRAFELNPDLAAGGELVREHLLKRHPEAMAEDLDKGDALLRERGAAVGLDIRTGPERRIWNSFDAHRLVAWAGEAAPARQTVLAKALFAALFSHGLDISDHAALAAVAGEAGLDAAEAAAVLASDRYAEAVRADNAHWRDQRLDSVPATVVEGQYMVRGGQPPEVIEEGLRRILAKL